MEDYLRSYLEVLPESQRRRIEEILKENEDLYNIRSVTEEEFRELVRRLAEDHQPLTTRIFQTDKLDEDLFNAFFSNVYVDLNMLFMEHGMAEAAATNYERLFDGILGELNREVKALRDRVSTLRLTSEGEDGLIVKKYSFEDQSQMETDREKYGHLFVDRDGTPINDVVLERTHDQYYIVLGKTKEVDCIRDENGQPAAKIEIKERRGVPVQILDRPERYALENAIDDSPETYWAEVVLTDKPINMPMKK